MSVMDLEAIQVAVREAGFDGWLFYDHHHRDRERLPHLILTPAPVGLE